MKYILQIFTGPWYAEKETSEAIIKKLDEMNSRLDIAKVIIGWNTDACLYRKVGTYLHEKGIQMLLWLPVFSEVSAIAQPDEARDVFGKAIITPIEQEGEDFVFGCPSSPHNRQIVKDIYEQYFSDCEFDGVFLDKIRSQSFISGVSGVLSCGCNRCRKAYLDKGVDIAAVRDLYEERKDSFFDMSSFPMNVEFRLADALAQRFFEAKEAIIAEAVADICQYFRGKGMIIGLDLFAPVISRFVGQNYSQITKHADFIKPMLYRKTEAPAGIGYEIALYRHHAPKAQGQIDIKMDTAFLHMQLEAVERVTCEKYPGIEINYREDIARTTPEYIIESLTAVRDHGFDGASLCWNAMLAPEAHIEAIARFENS